MKRLDSSELLPGDVLLYRASDSWSNAVSVLIRKLDGTQVSHAGMYLGDDQVGESLIAGNPGLNTNPLHDSIAGCEWVEVRRLQSTDDLGPVMKAAYRRISEGNRYGYDQILLVAAICVARKIDLGDGLLRKIVYAVLQKANYFVRSMTSVGREPMICSEFVYRAYDEALLEDDDKYSLAILAQSSKSPRRLWSGRRRRERLFGSQPETDLPTVEMGSLLAQFLDEPAETGETVYGASPTIEVTAPALDAMIYEWSGERPPQRFGAPTEGWTAADSSSVSEVSESQVEILAREFVVAVADAPLIEEPDQRLYGMAPPSASKARRALTVIADYVTPGDLLKSPSLQTAGRLHP